MREQKKRKNYKELAPLRIIAIGRRHLQNLRKLDESSLYDGVSFIT